VKVNNRKVLDGVMESIGLGGDENAGRRLTVLRAIDKLDRLGVGGVTQLLGGGRKDESGDFTKGAGLNSEQAARVINRVSTDGDGDTGSGGRGVPITGRAPDKDPSAGRTVRDEGDAELFEIQQLVRASGYGRDQIRIDPSVVRGLEYYTGPVYEVELLLDTKDEKGRPVRFGSVGGGGRYDGLVSRFRGELVPATGFSIGVSRLQAALTTLGKLDTRPKFGPVVVTVFGGEIADYQKMVATLRSANIRAELYLGNPKHSLGQQMKYADKRNAPCAIVQGSDERANGKIQIKDLILGAGLTEIKDREVYLKKQSEAQYEVDQNRLVEAVREVLARHDVKWN
jgi:histidyl-tRNA synthetase